MICSHSSIKTIKSGEDVKVGNHPRFRPLVEEFLDGWNPIDSTTATVHIHYFEWIMLCIAEAIHESIGSLSTDSSQVKTEVSTWPSSFPTLLHHSVSLDFAMPCRSSQGFHLKQGLVTLPWFPPLLLASVGPGWPGAMVRLFCSASLAMGTRL